MRILLADHSERMLNVLHCVLVTEPEIQIVGKVMNTDGLCAAAHELLPDLILFDWKLARSQSQALVLGFHQLRPETKVVAMVTHIEDGRAALAAGVDAFVSKSGSPDWLLDTMRRLATMPVKNPV